MTTIADLERLARLYGFVPRSVLDDWNATPRTDAERDAAQIAILRGVLDYAASNLYPSRAASR